MGTMGRRRMGRTARAGARRQRGAALVEFAIVFPLLFVLITGIVDFGLTFVNINSVRQGVREGARQAVVANFGTSSSCTTTSSTELPDATKRLICLTKDRIGLDESTTRIKVAFVGANEVGDSLMVCAQYPMSSTTGVFGPVLDGRIITGKVEMRLEKMDEDLEAAQESPLPGRDWGFCS